MWTGIAHRSQWFFLYGNRFRRIAILHADLIRQVWQNFIAYLGISDYGEFSVDTYINEFYLVTVAKIICVNVLAGAPVVSTRNEIQQILDGGYFSNQNIENLVDYDYSALKNHTIQNGCNCVILWQALWHPFLHLPTASQWRNAFWSLEWLMRSRNGIWFCFIDLWKRVQIRICFLHRNQTCFHKRKSVFL